MKFLRHNWFEFGLLAQIVVGALMFGIGIGSAPFWNDEVTSMSIAERSLGEIFGLLENTDANMGSYYVVLKFWTSAASSEPWVRALSAISALAAIPTTALLARRLFGSTTGLVAGFLLAGSMFVVVHAQNARAYALALFLITLATLLFVKAVESGRSTHFFAYGVLSAAAIYASPLSGLVVIAHATTLAFLPQARDQIRPFAVTYGALLIALSPLAGLMRANGTDQLAWISPASWSAARDIALETLGGGNELLAIAFGALILIGLIALCRGWNERQTERWRWGRWLVIGWLIFPPVLLYLISLEQPLFVARFLLTSAPAVAIIAAVGVVALIRRSPAVGTAAIAILVGLALIARIESKPYEGGIEGWGQSSWEAGRTIAAQSKAGDGVLYVSPWQRLPVGWHLEHEAGADAHLPSDFAIDATAEELDEIYAREVVAEVLVRRLRHQQRVWLVSWDWDFAVQTPVAVAGVPVLESEFRRVRQYDLGLYRVELYERDSRTPANALSTRPRSGDDHG